MTVLGVDGCPAGWIGVANSEGELSAVVKPEFSDLLEVYGDLERVFVDVPIGLPESDRRRCDVAARELLGSRGSSVFYTPSRAAVEVYVDRLEDGYRPGTDDEYEDASEANRNVMDDGLSKQAWNIVPKIAELDEYLRADPTRNDWVIESHPECCFLGLNAGQPLAYSKSTPVGLAQRRAILADQNDGTEDVYAEVLDEYYRKDVARDDILDAIALALIAERSEDHDCLPDGESPEDERGLPKRIVYAGPLLEDQFAEYREDPA